MDNLVLNLLVFNQDVTEGKLQKELIEKGMNLGFKALEIRREYFKDIQKEAAEIKKLVDDHHLELFYSVPDEVFVERFNAAMRDDFNTSEAIAVLFEINKALNTSVKDENAEQAAVYYATLRHLTDILGLVQHNVDDFLKSDIGQEALGLTVEQIEDLIQQRVDAKKAKEFARADEIRQSLLDQGVVLEDTRQGTIWRRAD